MDEWLHFVKIRNIDVIPSSRNPNLINVRLQFSINADETVETINLNLATDDEQANDADLAIFNSV